MMYIPYLWTSWSLIDISPPPLSLCGYLTWPKMFDHLMSNLTMVDDIFGLSHYLNIINWQSFHFTKGLHKKLCITRFKRYKTTLPIWPQRVMNSCYCTVYLKFLYLLFIGYTFNRVMLADFLIWI